MKKKIDACIGSYFEWSVPITDRKNIYDRVYNSIWQNKPKGLKSGDLVALQVLKIPRVAVSIGSQHDKDADNPLYLDIRQFPASNVPIRVGEEVYISAAWEQATPQLFSAQSNPPARDSDEGIRCTAFDDGVQVFMESVDESVAANRFRPVIYVRGACGEWARYWVEIDLRDTTPVYRQSQLITVPVRDGDRILAYPDFFSGSPPDGARVSYGRLTAPNPATTNPDDLTVRFGATILGEPNNEQD